MNSIRQLIRQPMKALSGILLITLAVAILCICMGQAMTALNIGTSMDDLFTTIALPTGQYQRNTWGTYLTQLPEGASHALTQLVEENSELIEEASPLGLASAYIPELVADNFTSYPAMHGGSYYGYCMLLSVPEGAPYTCAMLEFTLEELREPVEQEDGSIQVILRGPILSAVGLQEGYNDPVGLTAHITLCLPSVEALEELELKVGGRCLAYGMDYYDNDWANRCAACNAWETGEITIQEMDPAKLQYLSEEQIALNKEMNSTFYDVAFYMDGTAYLQILNIGIDHFRAVTLTAKDASIMPEYADLENTNQYAVPTVTMLTGSVEDFLASEEGAAWQDALDLIEVNNHAFPVVGVTKLNAVSDFNRGSAEVVEGRDFTAEERETGANVCILSQTVAELSGLTVGDTITLNYYQNDEDLPYQDSLAEGNGLSNAAAAMYLEAATPFVGEGETYTIVGVYQQDNPLSGYTDNLYAFTSNTVFVPQKAVPSQMEHTDMLLFGTLQLKNGSIEAFADAMHETDYEYYYEFYDQGYSLVQENLQNYSALARQAMTVGVVVWAIVVLLFLVLFPARQGDAVARMASLGTPRLRKLGHMLASALGILVPGTVLGLTLGILLWETAVGRLTAAVAVDLDLSLNIPLILLIALAQLAAATAAAAVIAAVMTRNKSLMKKR